jgi:hypothetical protein
MVADIAAAHCCCYCWWCSCCCYLQVWQSFATSLRNLHTEHIDSLVLHSPLPSHSQSMEGEQKFATFLSSVRQPAKTCSTYTETWLLLLIAQLHQHLRLPLLLLLVLLLLLLLLLPMLLLLLLPLQCGVHLKIWPTQGRCGDKPSSLFSPTCTNPTSFSATCCDSSTVR